MAQIYDVQALVRELKDGLHDSQTQADIVKWLTTIKSILVQDPSPVIPKGKDTCFDADIILWLHKNISDFHIKQILELILTKFSIEWTKALGSENFKALVKPIFLHRYLKYGLIVLLQAVTGGERKDFKFQQSVSLLEEFVSQTRLAKLLIDQSKCGPEQAAQLTQGAQELDAEQQLLLGCITSLPEKMANKLRHDNSDVFLPQSYIPMVALSIVDSLEWAHQVLSRGENVSLHFISVLIGKLCIVGYANPLLETLVPRLCVRVRKDYLWCRICERLFTRLPPRCVEAALVPLLKQIPWYGLVDKFLGDAVVHNTNIKMLLCTKLLLHRTFPRPKTLQHNIMGYLSTFHTRRHLLVEVCMRLLRVWGDASSVRHISAEQHGYISRALLVSISYLNQTEKSTNESEFLRLLMPGVQVHLESSDPAFRMLGMVVAKTLTQCVAPTGPQLEFEIDMANPDVLDLLSYTSIPDDPGVSEREKAVQDSENEVKKVEEEMASLSMKGCEMKEVSSNAESDLDSDDDLQPYDMSHDKKVSKAKQPKFIRDCMEGLICSSDDPDRTEMCLAASEALIRKKTDGLDEIAVEFAKILLHLSDTHSFLDFQDNRFKSLVALTVTCPSQVAEYLTNEFYVGSYSIRQRMDILETLASAAQELSSIEKQPESRQSKLKPGVGGVETATPSSEPAHWREVIQQRIESNTRRFGRGRSRPEPVATLNRFAPVAGKFFFPLMCRADQGSPSLDLIGRDSLLLYRLLYTLAVVLHSAKNVLECVHMGKALLEFTWSLRLHPDSSVRQAVLVATTTVFLVVPAHALLADLHSDVTETKAWLEGVVEQDPDTECQKMAAQALFLLQDQIKKEVESSGPNS